MTKGGTNGTRDGMREREWMDGMRERRKQGTTGRPYSNAWYIPVPSPEEPRTTALQSPMTLITSGVTEYSAHRHPICDPFPFPFQTTNRIRCFIPLLLVITLASTLSRPSLFVIGSKAAYERPGSRAAAYQTSVPSQGHCLRGVYYGV